MDLAFVLGQRLELLALERPNVTSTTRVNNPYMLQFLA